MAGDPPSSLSSSSSAGQSSWFKPPEPVRTVLSFYLLAVSMGSLLSYFKLLPGQRASIYKLIYTVPASHAAETKAAIFAAGGGTYDSGRYTNTTFESPGVGTFTPDGAAGANPAVGEPGREERVDEVRVEVRCEGLDVARAAVKALLRTHPYETPGYEVFKAEDALMKITKKQALDDDY